MPTIINGTNGIDKIQNGTVAEADLDFNVATQIEIDAKADITYVDNKPSGFKNYIINGGFDVWQRGTSFTSGGYTADRWKLSFSGIDAVALSKGIDEKDPYLRMAITANDNYVRIRQPIENAGNSLFDKTVTVSFYARSSASSSCYVDFHKAEADYTPTGLGDNISEFHFDLTTTWQRYEATYNVPSSFNDDIWFGIWTDDVHTLDIKKVQLEEGSVATPFEQRPYGLELSLCQRYYAQSTAGSDVTTISWYAANGGTLCVDMEDVAMRGLRFPVVMRTIPTFTPYVSGVANAIKSYGGNATRNVTTVYRSAEGISGLRHDGGYTIGRPYAFTWIADAEL